MDKEAISTHTLLELYRLLVNIEEEYYTSDSILKKQKILDDLRNVREEINQLDEAINELEELKRVPTAEEVCEVIQNQLILKNKVIYDEKDKSFCLEYGNPPIYSIPLTEFKEGFVWYHTSLTTPKILILIGKFYEGNVKADVS